MIGGAHIITAKRGLAAMEGSSVQVLSQVPLLCLIWNELRSSVYAQAPPEGKWSLHAFQPERPATGELFEPLCERAVLSIVIGGVHPAKLAEAGRQ